MEMNYEEMWKRLEIEVNDLTENNIQNINPALLISYMSYIKTTVTLQEKVFALEKGIQHPFGPDE